MSWAFILPTIIWIGSGFTYSHNDFNQPLRFHSCKTHCLEHQPLKEVNELNLLKQYQESIDEAFCSDIVIKTIVLDPGHGGKDGGCTGKNSVEKHIALKIGLKLKGYISTYYPKVEVYMTRERDVFVPLYERAAFANRLNADLFMSIHCNNINSKKKINGTETYVLGLHVAEENLEVVKRENASIQLEKKNEYNYIDPNSTEGHIMMEMYQKVYLEQSLLLAQLVEKNMHKGTIMKSRGVKQAGFAVLRETKMPSVLIEVGYLSDADDNKYLISAEGQEAVSQSILQAFGSYKDELQNAQSSIVAFQDPLVQSETPKKEPVKTNPPPDNSSKEVKKKEQVAPPAKEQPTPTVKITSKDQKISIPSKNEPQSLEESVNLEYFVQLGAFSKEQDLSKEPWSTIKDVKLMNQGAVKKYVIREIYSLAEAIVVKDYVRKNGFKDAFLVVTNNGERIPLTEAIQLESK